MNRMVAFVDKNRDMFLAQVRRSKPKLAKLGTMVQSLKWHDAASLLAGGALVAVILDVSRAAMATTFCDLSVREQWGIVLGLALRRRKPGNPGIVEV